jgi:hypothetical protein
VTQTLPASQIIKEIIADTPNADASPQSLGLGNPAKDSTTPDVVVTLQPGYIWVGNVLNKHKRGEHGGFSDDDTHVALVLGGGALPKNVRGTTQTSTVHTTQIAVTVLDALGLDPSQLTGAKKEHTKPLPGTGIKAKHALSEHSSAHIESSGLTAVLDENVRWDMAAKLLAGTIDSSQQNESTTPVSPSGMLHASSLDTLSTQGTHTQTGTSKGTTTSPLVVQHAVSIFDSVLDLDEIFESLL